MQEKNNVLAIIVTAYFPAVSAITGVAYITPLESLTIMKIQNDHRTKFWIDLNNKISKWVDKGEQLIFMGYYNSEASEVNTLIKT